MPILEGFAPIGSKAPRFFVLGSFPSARSLEKGEYYGHGRNQFWAIMGETLGFDPGASYAERERALSEAGLALWDVFSSCEREGSLDKDIRGGKANPIAEFIASRPSIEAIGLNGGLASSAFVARVAPELRARALAMGEFSDWRPGFAAGRAIRVMRLPSTSPVPTRDYRGAQDKLPLWHSFFLA